MQARPLDQSPSRPGAELGFVLPYVLAVIAVISLLAVIAAKSLETGQGLAASVKNQIDLGLAADEAEEIVTYVFLVSPVTGAGLDLSGREINEDAILEGTLPSAEGLADADIWRANGGRRRIEIRDLDVRVRYQDADSLVSLSTTSPDIVERWLARLPQPPADPEGMAAKLDDFRDSDNDRQYKGSERADYRLLQLQPPSNSSIRGLQELRSVLGWQDFAVEVDPDLLSELTWFYTNPVPREAGMPPALTERLAQHERELFTRAGRELAFELFAGEVLPGPRGQFDITVCDSGAATCLRRIVEIEKTRGGPDLPYYRRLVFEGISPMTDGPAEETIDDELLLPQASQSGG